jgi:hypothetical protein
MSLTSISCLPYLLLFALLCCFCCIVFVFLLCFLLCFPFPFRFPFPLSPLLGAGAELHRALAADAVVSAGLRCSASLYFTLLSFTLLCFALFCFVSLFPSSFKHALILSVCLSLYLQ